MAMALVAGIFAVRLTWHYFAIITVVFSLIFYFLAVSMKWLTGGDDGINFALPPTFTFGSDAMELRGPKFPVLLYSRCRGTLLLPDAPRYRQFTRESIYGRS